MIDVFSPPTIRSLDCVPHTPGTGRSAAVNVDSNGQQTCNYKHMNRSFSSASREMCNGM